MGKRKYPVKAKPMKCIAYLSVIKDDRYYSQKEEKQLNAIMEYANAHNIMIVDIVRRGIFGKPEVERQFTKMCQKILLGKADGIIVTDLRKTSFDVYDSYMRVGKVASSGGKFITVEKGEQKLILE